MVNWDDLENDVKKNDIYTIGGRAHELAKKLFEKEKEGKKEKSTSQSQLRNLLTVMESIQKKIKDDKDVSFQIQRLYPILANMVAKKGSGANPITQAFYDEFTREIQNVKTKKGFEEFLEFYKAVIQFHAYEAEVKEKR